MSGKLEPLSGRVIGAAFAVANALGHGFPEAVYKRALMLELGEQGILVREEVPFPVFYRGRAVGNFVLDLVVENTIIVELKAVERLVPAHLGQVSNYLRASQLPLGLLINFGRPKVEVRRLTRSATLQ